MAEPRGNTKKSTRKTSRAQLPIEKKTNNYRNIQELPPRNTESDNTINNWKGRYSWIPSEKKDPQKWLQLQVRQVWDYPPYCQVLLENSIKERSTLKGVTMSGLSLAVKHAKEALGNEGLLVMKINTAKKGSKNLLRSLGSHCLNIT